MCRLFIYKGPKYKIKDLIWLPWNSILKQSFKEPYTPHQNIPNPRDHPINVDGFGMCWYCEENKACLYTNTMPPWNDFNLLNLTQYIETHLFFSQLDSNQTEFFEIRYQIIEKVGGLCFHLPYTYLQFYSTNLVKFHSN